ncbi:substrate-binding domain-containing protein [Actinoalloteichus sp. GBA129-24]|uniref:substrate-binding domain-containing protein n=1 Tax=Actinoalloteichus sp. GBA129-24 TaxID=1612551 RepID=UPI0009504836|nr:substrate-binding domain-containing protein [Actinoalloteichus sp. GBA129-24]APU19325.1 hypothetical protein UA75_06510 [Actinoalloteichus sp. GBA129-24]
MSEPIRHRGRGRLPWLLLATVLVTALLAWAAVDRFPSLLGGPDCSDSVTLTVMAAPSVAPLLDEVTTEPRTDENDDCYHVDVRSVDSAEAVEVLADPREAAEYAAWLPESSMWLRRARANGATEVPDSGGSIASSPVVLALPPDAAAEHGDDPSWSALLGPEAGEPSVWTADPSRSATATSMLWSVRRLARDAEDPVAAATGRFRLLAEELAADEDELYQRLADTDELPAALTTSEQRLLQYRADAPEVELRAAYPERDAPSLDFPFVPLLDATQREWTAAGALGSVLRSAETVRLLGDHRLRTPGGEAIGEQDAPESIPPVSQPDTSDVDETLGMWAGASRSGRLLAALDVSGSMNDDVPGTGRTRMELAIGATEQGIGMLLPTTRLGLWTFSTRLDGDLDYREVLPVLPVREHTEGSGLDDLRSITAQPGGGTGLYDTTLAAYEAARQGWEPGRTNTVVVLTDGRDEDSESIGLPRLLSSLRDLQDPTAPLPIVLIGIGPDIDVDALQQIADVTGGRVFTADDPADMGEIFLGALGSQLCQPPGCEPG